VPYRSWQSFDYESNNKKQMLTNHLIRQRKLDNVNDSYNCTDNSESRLKYLPIDFKQNRAAKILKPKDTFRLSYNNNINKSNDNNTIYLGSTEYKDKYNQNLSNNKNESLNGFTINPKPNLLAASKGRPSGDILTHSVTTQYKHDLTWPQQHTTTF
jgi:hypothetical protein